MNAHTTGGDIYDGEGEGYMTEEMARRHRPEA
jgi:hypothetical protein